MKKIKSLILVAIIPLIMLGCASIPKEEELQQLNNTQLSELLPGHTLTYKADWGRWAEYHNDGSTGVGKGWGSWGEENATSDYTINQDGEVCWTYMGEWDWAKPEYKYCGLIYTDQSGMYYSKTTENTWKPERIGNRRKVEITEGDRYELTKN
jgi:hypothetical protein